MKTLPVAAMLLAAGIVLPASQSAPKAFDPVGTWKVTTISDEGQPMSISVTISGTPGSYTGQANTGSRTLPLTDLATTPTGMIAVFALPQGSIVVQMGAGKDGKFSGTWGEMPQTFGLSAERGK